MGKTQGLVQRRGPVDHPRRLTGKCLLEVLEAPERRRVAGALADEHPASRVAVLAVVQGQIQYRGEIEHDGRAGAVKAAVAAWLDTADDAVVARVLPAVAPRSQRLDHRAIVVQGRGGARVQIHIAQTAQVGLRIDLGMEASVEVGVAQHHQFGGADHQIGQIVDRVRTVGMNPAHRDGLVGSGSAEKLLAGGGNRGHVVADLQPQATEKFDGFVDSELPVLDVLAIEFVQQLVEPAQAEAHVGVFQMDGGPADPDGGQALSEGARGEFGHVLVRLGHVPQLGPFSHITGLSGQSARLARQVAGKLDDALHRFHHRRVELALLGLLGTTSPLLRVLDDLTQTALQDLGEIRDGVRDTVGLAGYEENQILQQDHLRHVAMPDRLADTILVHAGAAALEHAVFQPVGKHLLVEDLHILVSEEVRVARAILDVEQLGPESQTDELGEDGHALEVTGGRSGEQGPRLDREGFHVRAHAVVGGDHRLPMLQHVTVLPGLVQNTDGGLVKQPVLPRIARDQRRSFAADLGHGVEVRLP